MNLKTIRVLPAAMLLGFFLLPRLAQAAPANWRCTSWRENKAVAGGKQCTQWSTGPSAGVGPGATVPPPPFMKQGGSQAKPAVTGAAKGAPAHPAKSRRRNRRRKHREG